MDNSNYIPSNEWELLTASARRNVIKYQCCPDLYPDLTFRINIKRQATFYNFVLIIPCVLLSVLTLVVFWLPCESPAKMMLG